jgi:SAM-dependent methyltransferase
MNQNQNTTAYWNTYYSSLSAPILPSQFAIFMLSEMPNATSVVEFGSGNGRDSLFFARNGCHVLGVDGSQKGVESCKVNATANMLPAQFLCSDVSNLDLAKQILDAVKDFPDGDFLVYARFFIHSISDKAESILLDHIRTIFKVRPGQLGLEFRTHRDACQTKVTPTHYRRFVDPAQFIFRAARHNLQPVYSVSGFGMAKYKEDDAHVARLILTSAS